MKNIHTFVSEAFKAGGGLSRCMTGYRENPTQLDYAHAVADVLTYPDQDSPVGLLEAETGTGKSLGYLVPLAWVAAEGKRVAISTYTNQLLYQGLHDAFPVIQALCLDMLGVSLSASPRLGLANFVNQERALKAVAGCEAPESPLATAFLRWVTAGGFLLHEWMSEYGSLPAGVSVHEIVCRVYDSEEELAQYNAHLTAAEEADFVFTNHSLSIMHVVGRPVFTGERPLSALVVDEADRLSAAAEAIVSRGSSLRDLKLLLQSGAKQTADSNLQRQCNKAADEVDGLWDALRHLRPSDRDLVSLVSAPAAVNEAAADLLGVVDRFIKYLSRTNRSGLFNSEWMGELQSHHAVLSSIQTPKWNGYVAPAIGWQSAAAISWSDCIGIPSFKVVPVNPAQALARYTESFRDRKALDSLILTSATLGDGREDGLAVTAREFGFFDHARIVKQARYEPDHFGSVEFILSDGVLPVPSDAEQDGRSSPQWLENTAAMIREAAACGERVLALTLSRRDTQALGELLSDHPTLLLHLDGVKLPGLLKDYRETDGAILVSPSAWEGVDLPGLVPNLVITRLPFAPPNRSEEIVCREWMMSRGYSDRTCSNIIYSLTLSAARRRFRQGFGRSIRGPHDHSTIWIADPRFVRRNDFRSVLPARFREDVGPNQSALSRARIWMPDGSMEVPEKREVQADWTVNAW